MKIINKSYPSSRYCSHITTNNILGEVTKRNSYVLRLCALVSQFIGVNVINKGHVIMLTFTYNNENLPFAINPETNERVPVFNREHVKMFLNRLKVRHSRFMRGFYKYFFCFEYGKNTKRQHIHALFCLSSECDLRLFIDTCRELWTFGHMFPAPFGNPYQKAQLRHAGKGASYAAKYVCKDLSYYEMPVVQRYIEYIEKQSDEDKKILRNGLPRIYQSNGIGSNLIDQLDSNFDEVVKYGILNPLTNKRAPIPYYVYNKYFFKTIPAFDSRVGKNGKTLYDRVMIKDDSSFLDYKLEQLNKSIERSCMFFDNSALSFKTIAPNAETLYNTVLKLKSITGIDDTYTLSFMFQVYKSYVRCASDKLLYCVDTFNDLFTVDFVKNFLVDSLNVYKNYKDSLEYNKVFPITSCFTHNDIARAIFDCLNILCDVYSYFLEDIQLIRESDFQKQEKVRELLRTYNYPVNLC